jgi:hypothetical protein
LFAGVRAADLPSPPQGAVGGIALSLLAMVAAALGYLPPVAGAVVQEAIDVAAVEYALRTAIPPRTLTDY